MKLHFILLVILPGILCPGPSSVRAAVVQKVIGKASSPANTVLGDGAKFATGDRSKSDLSLQHGFFRVGSDTGVQVVTQNGLSLEKGIMLVGSDPAKAFRRSVSVAAPGYKMEIKGTAQIAYYPGAYIKITVLEGRVRVALQSLTGEWETLEPGQMLIINPSDKRLPEPVEVDIGRLASTSQLIGGAFAKLSTQGLIDAAASNQASAMHGGTLAPTPLRLTGASPEATLSLSNRKARETTQLTGPASRGVTAVEQDVFALVNDLADPDATVVERPFADGALFSLFPSADAGGALTIQREGARTQKLTVYLTSGINDFGEYTGPATVDGRIRISPDVFAGTAKTFEIRSAEFGLTVDEVLHGTTDYALHLLPGTDIETPPGVALRVVGDLGLDIQNARLQAGSGASSSEDLTLTARSRFLQMSGSSGSGWNIRVEGSTNISAEQQQPVTIDSSRLTARQNLSLGNEQKQTSIVLQNSTQLSALVGSITVQSAGGPISIDGSSLHAGGSITLDAFNSLTGTGSSLRLTNSLLSADVLRARAFSASGDAMVIDGSTLSAASLIKLYGEGASSLRFKNNVQLNAPLTILSAREVVVDSGGSVHISGEARIHADSTRFNVPGQGTLNASGGASISPRSTRPSF